MITVSSLRARRKAPPVLLTVKQVARLAQYDPQTIYRKVWADAIPGVERLGRVIRFQRTLVLPWAARVRRMRADARAL